MHYSMRTFRLLFINLFMCIGINSMAQTPFNTESKDSTNVYHYSLIKYCDYLDKLESRPNIIYIEKNYFITDKLPSNIRGYELRYFNQRDIKNYLKGKDQMTLVRIVPLRVERRTFS